MTRWSSLVDSHGLKLVQLPLEEASKLHETHPFSAPVAVRLAMPPPSKILATPRLDPHAVSPRAAEDSNGYHKALLRKLDFVLDREAASSFPRSLHIAYSWGRPDYELSQFVHTSGLLAQISNDGTSDFLLVRNPLTGQTSASTNKTSDATGLEGIVRKVVGFCRNESALKAFYEEINKPKASPLSPLANATIPTNSDIPPFELPPHLIHRAQKFGGTVT